MRPPYGSFAFTVRPFKPYNNPDGHRVFEKVYEATEELCMANSKERRRVTLADKRRRVNR